jgi:hypothetical protein
MYSARRFTAMKRRLACCRLRLQGLTMAAISQRLGISKTRVFELLAESMKLLKQDTRTAAGELLLAEVQYVNRLLAELVPLAVAGNTHAAGRVMQLLSRHDRLTGRQWPHDELPPDGAAPGPDGPDSEPDPSPAACRRIMEERHVHPCDDLAGWPGPGADRGPSAEEKLFAAERARALRDEYGLGDESLTPVAADADDHE